MEESPAYREFVQRWAKPVLDTLDAIAALPPDQSTAQVDGIVADFLFSANLVTVSHCKDLDAWNRTPQFDEFYSRFKKTPMYEDMEQVRSGQSPPNSFS